MFTLGISVTFLVGVFVAAWYSKLSPLRAMVVRNGFAKTVYLKSKKEQKAEARVSLDETGSETGARPQTRTTYSCFAIFSSGL